MPVGVVVTFLWALVATPSSCFVLTGVDGRDAIQVLWGEGEGREGRGCG